MLLHSPREQVVAQDEDGDNALCMAVEGGHSEFARLLLLHCPADQVTVDESGRSALMSAADGGDVECMKLLLPYFPDTQPLRDYLHLHHFSDVGVEDAFNAKVQRLEALLDGSAD